MKDAEFRHYLLQRARELRKHQTQAEAILWEKVRDRRLGGFKFRRQYAHIDKLEIDEQRDYEILFKGYKTLRFTNSEVITDIDKVCGQILTIFSNRQGQAHRNSNRYTDNY